ncbi:MAG: glycosyltransferase [Bacilli bacterium]|nr:glycosyltransferase [Bacilli bacterium]
MLKLFFIMSTDDFSGAESVNFSIIKSLNDKYDFYWVSKRGNINAFLRKNDIKYIEIRRLSVKEINGVINKYKPDILHATDYKASTICALSKKGKIPLISHLHNNSPWLKKIHPFSFALLYVGLKSDKIITVSNSIEKEYIFSKFIHKKIINLGNPIDRNSIIKQVNNDDYKKKYDICCVGRLTKQKNPLKFIEIIKEIRKIKKNVKVVWVGKGELLSECIKKRDYLGLKNTIDYVGFKDNPYKYMAASKIFVLCSEWEGFGLVAFEALSLGLPAVVSNIGGLPDIVDNYCGRLCDNNTDFINEINLLLSSDEYYNLKTKSAIEKSIIIENADNYYSRLGAIYDDMI